MTFAFYEYITSRIYVSSIYCGLSIDFLGKTEDDFPVQQQKAETTDIELTFDLGKDLVAKTPIPGNAQVIRNLINIFESNRDKIQEEIEQRLAHTGEEMESWEIAKLADKKMNKIIRSYIIALIPRRLMQKFIPCV